jgi:hypothetical protein
MTPPLATSADVEAVPEHVRAERIAGELVLQAYPSVDHPSVLVLLTTHLQKQAPLPPFGGAPADVAAWWGDLDPDEGPAGTART